MNYYVQIYFRVVGALKTMLNVKFSEKGSNKRKEEEQAYVHFNDFMDECEGNNCK